MKITVRQLKQLIKEQIEEQRNKRKVYDKPKRPYDYYAGQDRERMNDGMLPLQVRGFVVPREFREYYIDEGDFAGPIHTLKPEYEGLNEFTDDELKAFDKTI